MVSVRLLSCAVLLSAFVASAAGAEAAVPAKTQILNRASLSYSDARNTSYTTVSNQVDATVAAVSGLTLTPNSPSCDTTTDAFISSKSLLKTFLLTNGGNEPDSFILSSLSATNGKVRGASFLVGTQSFPAFSVSRPNASPVVPAGGSIAIAVAVDASGDPAGTRVITTIAVHSTMTAQNGFSSASAEQCGVTAAPPNLTGLGGGGSTISKLVNALPATQAASGSNVDYSIAFMNSGGSTATDVTIVDPLPTGISYVAGTAVINGVAVPASSVSLAGQTIKVYLGSVAVHELVTVTFEALVSAQARSGQSLINVASVNATNASQDSTAPAAVLVGNANIVFDGDLGAKAPISGATVELIPFVPPGAHVGNPVAFTGQPMPTNTKNADPFMTDASGAYALGLSPKQGGSYELVVSAPGFVTRYLKLVVTPDPTGSFYKVLVVALDGSQLTAIGTFDLVGGPVTIPATYGIFGNIPMFRTGNVTLSKTVDRATASSGDRLIYTLDVQNGASALGTAAVVDDLPPGIAYAPKTSRVDGVPFEPVQVGSTLTWNFPRLTQQHKIVFAAVILPTVEEPSILTNVATVAAHVATSATYTVGARATATTDVVAGVFSDRKIITGRVYLDRMDNARFCAGDTGLGGVRVYLEDGEYVVTDGDGKYDFPSVRPGVHVLRLDQTSLPPIAVPFDDRRIDSERSIRRLVHDAYDSGLLDDIDFALRPRS